MSNKIYVGNLSFNVQEQTLKDTFTAYGDVLSCKLIIDHETGRSKGFGFIEMDTVGDARTAISALDGYELDGRFLKVTAAKPQEKRERTFKSNRW